MSFFGNILKHERLGLELKNYRGREASFYVLLLTLPTPYPIKRH